MSKKRELKRVKKSSNYTEMILNAQPHIIIESDGDEIIRVNRAFFKLFEDFKTIGEFKNRYNCICELFKKPNDSDDDYIYNFKDKNWVNHLLKHQDRQFKVILKYNSIEYIFKISAHSLKEFSSKNSLITLTDITELENMKKDKLNDVKLASIGKLTAGITHEINTPLTYIKGHLELLNLDISELEESNLRTHIVDKMHTINDGIERISNIIESMKEITGKSSDKKEKINLYSTVVNALVMLNNRSKHIANIYLNGIKFDMGIDKNREIFKTYAFRQRMEQVWIIIINNALDEFLKLNLPFEEKRIDISISNFKDYLNRERIKIIFEDNAGGIDKSIIEKIFEPFVSNKVQSGMGIGLNIAELIIKKHKGSICAYNGKYGAVFEILI